MWEPVALCCFTRRTGCLVLGSLEVVGAIFALLIGAYLFINEVADFSLLCSHQTSMPMEECVEHIQPAVDTIIVILMVCGVVQLVCASMMIHGVRKNNHCLMCPFLIKNAAVVVLKIIFVGLGLVGFMSTKGFSTGDFMLMILAAYLYGALIFTSTYFLLTVRAYYYELKRGKADDYDKLVEKF